MQCFQTCICVSLHKRNFTEKGLYRKRDFTEKGTLQKKGLYRKRDFTEKELYREELYGRGTLQAGKFTVWELYKRETFSVRSHASGSKTELYLLSSMTEH